MSDTDITNDNPNNEKESTDNWDKDRQHRDEIRAAGEREGSLKANNESLNAENERLKVALKEADDVTDANNTAIVAPETYEELAQRHTQLEGTVNQIAQDNKALRQTVESVQQSANATSGQSTLATIAAENEQRLGRNDLTNDVLKQVNQRYQEQNINDWPDDQRQRWIRQELKLEYNDQNAAKPKKSDDSTDINLGGPGDGQPSGTVTPGTQKRGC